MPSAKRAIVNADDFGLSAGVTDGILRAHSEGIVTSTTIMANMPAAGYALGRLTGFPNLGVGVHLNASQGRPLSREGLSLAGQDGVMRHTATGIVMECCRRPGLLTAVVAEFDAQIRWVVDHGLSPTHLDSHRHTHAFTPLYLRVVRLAQRYRIRFIRWHREVLPGTGWPEVPRSQRLLSGVLNGLGAVNRWLAPERVATRGTWGIAHTGFVDAAWLIRAARCLSPGVTEIATHPGCAADVEKGLTRLIESRMRELVALCDPRVREAFKRYGIGLIHYGQLQSP